MKQRLLILLLGFLTLATSANAEVIINETNFPDESFRSYVSSAYDTDKDGTLSDDEIAQATILSLGGRSVADLTGIAYLTELTTIWISGNTELTRADLSGNTKLTDVAISHTPLASINLSGCTAIKIIYLPNNQLESISLASCPSLTTVELQMNCIPQSAMSSLIASLPETAGDKTICVYAYEEGEQNFITATQIANLQAKGWTVQYVDAEGQKATIPEITYYGLYIGDTQVTSENYTDLASLANVTAGTLAYDPATKTLTLSGLTLSSSAANALRVTDSETTIRLVGDNTITTTSTSTSAAALRVAGTTTLTGTGSLALKGNTGLLLGSLLTVEGGAQLNAMGSNYGILGLTMGAVKVTYLGRLSISGLTTQVKATGTNSGSIVDLGRLELGSTLAITSPTGVSFSNNNVVYNGYVVKAQVVIQSPDIPIDEAHFPDANFRAYLLAQTYGADAVLTVEERTSITSLKVNSRTIASLQGIEYLSELKELECCSCQMNSLDVSALTKLTQLICYNNQLTSLDVSALTELTYLNCKQNLLTTLDVSGLPKLTALNAMENQLTSVLVPPCMKDLHLNKNQLTSLDVSACTDLYFLNSPNNQLTSLDVSNKTRLRYLDVENNQLTSLNVTGCSGIESLTAYHNQLTTLDMTGSWIYGTLSIYDNQLTSEALDALIATWSQNEGNYYRTINYYRDQDAETATEGNAVPSDEQIEEAARRGRRFAYYDYETSKWVPYAVGYDLWLAGTQVTSANRRNLSYIDGVTGTASYDPDTQTLTLRDVTIETEEGYAFNTSINGLTINVQGTNTITNNSTSTSSIGMYIGTASSASYILTGTGSLTAKGYYGARLMGTLSVEGGVQFTCEGTGGCGFYGNSRGRFGSMLYYGKLAVSGENTVMRVKGAEEETSLAELSTLRLTDVRITSPEGACLTDHNVTDQSGNLVKGEWVVIQKPSYVIGDVNGNEAVSLADLTALTTLLKNGTTPPAAADVDGDTQVTTADIEALVQLILSK